MAQARFLCGAADGFGGLFDRGLLLLHEGGPADEGEQDGGGDESGEIQEDEDHH